MAIVKFYKNDIKKYVDLESFRPYISKLGMSLESESDTSIDIDITPNRPDLLYFYSFMREVLMHMDKYDATDYIIKGKPIGDVNISSDFKKFRPYSIFFAVKNCNLDGNSLDYLINFTDKLTDTYGRKRKKVALGIHNLDKITFPIFYQVVKDGKFIPLGMDKEVSFKEYTEKYDENNYKSIINVKGYPVLRDKDKIISLIPIINSKLTSIDSTTKNLLFDINGSDKTAVYNTACMIAASMVYQGYEVHPIDMRYGEKSESFSIKERDMSVRLNDFKNLIGVDLDKAGFEELMKRSGYRIRSSNSNKFNVTLPPYRTDVFSYVDILEDAAISYDYSNIPKKGIVSIDKGGNLDSLTQFENTVANAVVGLGYTEASNFILTNEDISFKKMNKKNETDKKYIKLKNSKTSTFSMVRTGILPGLMNDLSISADQPMPQRIFEIGEVYEIQNNKIKESLHLALVYEGSKANFNDLKSDLLGLMNYLNIKCELVESNAEGGPFEIGKSAKVMLYGKESGSIGKISESVSKDNFNLKEPVMALELELKDL